LLAGACGPGSHQDGSARPPNASHLPVFAPGVSGDIVTFSLAEYSIQPAILSLPADRELTFVARNDGTVPHSLSVFTNDVHLATELSAPGESHSVISKLAPGIYRFTYPVQNHARLGMTVIVTVTR
jgi:hypothetical protein